MSLSPRAKELALSDSQRKADTLGVPLIVFSLTNKQKDLQDHSLSPKGERSGLKRLPKEGYYPWRFLGFVGSVFDHWVSPVKKIAEILVP